MTQYIIGAVSASFVWGAVWMYRAHLAAEAATVVADVKQAASKVINKL